jgi:hypothetical protein
MFKTSQRIRLISQLNHDVGANESRRLIARLVAGTDRMLRPNVADIRRQPQYVSMLTGKFSHEIDECSQFWRHPAILQPHQMSRP